MRVSHRWLRELLEQAAPASAPPFDLAPAEIAELLTDLGLEVEGVEHYGVPSASIVVVRVVQVEPHPERKKLRLVTVDRGGVELRVVCGASNVPGPGGLVVLAPLGTHLPAVQLTLEPREIGGIVSEGMLCSETELGLAEGAEGILILPPGLAAPGTPFLDAMPGAADTIYELGITPNRPDALGHIGIARDLAVRLRRPFEVPGPLVESIGGSADEVLVKNLAPEACPRYGAAVVLDVRVRPSPAWLAWRLRSLGVRPISNVVDITNLLLLEFGHPMHAFDLDRVRGGAIVVRHATAGERLTTLDGVARDLEETDTVICDAVGPVALAGIMGGESSEIRAETTRVLLECAYFTPSSIRRTAKRLGIHTDSSHRFERGVDFEDIARVLQRAQQLLVELAEGKASPAMTVRDGALPSVPRARLRSSRLDAVLGVPVPFDEALDIVRRLGFTVHAVEGGACGPVADVSGVSYRPDVRREIDWIEEVARVRGLAQIPVVLPPMIPQRPRGTGKLENRIAHCAASLGLSEALTYAFVSEAELAALGAPKPAVRLTNPLTEERSVMRTSLLPGLLDALRRARRRGERSVRLFTTGAVFLPPTHAPVEGSPVRRRLAQDAGCLPYEEPRFAAVLAGPRVERLARPETDVYDAKGLAEQLVLRLTGTLPDVRGAAGSAGTEALHPRGAGEVLVDGQRVGVFGPLHPDTVEALDLEESAQVVELSLAALEGRGECTPKYRPIPRLPAVTRDVSVEAHLDLLAGQLAAEMRRAAGNLCENVELLDVFEGVTVTPGHRALTFRVTYRDPLAALQPDQARTLTDQEVDAQHQKVRTAVESLGARPR